MAKYSSYVKFISSTISNNIFHFIMIILEYIFSIYPSCFNLGIKFHLYQYNELSYEKSPNMKPISILTYIHWKYPFQDFYFSVFIFTCCFLIIYYLINYHFDSQNNKSNKTNLGIVSILNFYDIIFFRYFSLIFIDSCISLFIISFPSATVSYFIFPVLFILSLCT